MNIINIYQKEKRPKSSLVRIDARNFELPW